MHISNDRYFQELRRHELALRMIAHEARTCTIRLCTGLTDDRIRRLSKAYSRQPAQRPLRRRRGKSPRQVSFFVRSAHTQLESSLLTALFVSLGLVQRGAPKPSLHAGGLLCDAFEAHQLLVGVPTITFEHAWFLLDLLNRQVGVRVARCRRCEGMFLEERDTVLRKPCPFCTLKMRSGHRVQGSAT